MSDSLRNEQVDPKRSDLMRRIRTKDTGPELVVRRCLHSLGYRYRLHTKDLRGSPDIVLPKHRKVIFVHGCFWHRHEGCSHTTTPKTRTEFWLDKFNANIARDAQVAAELVLKGWRILVVWECQCRDLSELTTLLERFMTG